VEVGRGGVDISFDDVYLAHRHCRFENGPEGPRVVPVDSLNGVLYRIDGATEINHGAVLLLGRELLRFELCDQVEREPVALIRHGVTLFGSPLRRPWARLCQLLGNGGMLDVRHLLGDEVIVGREEGDVIFADDEFLSRRHAAFRPSEAGGIVEDLHSSNGTFLRLTGPRLIGPGDHLRVGDQMFRFELPNRGLIP
jgi:pSer/pThr/pTyr-binding forkhead associated (FHA) protein